MPDSQFRKQVILCARSMHVTAVEILAALPASLRFDDPEFMLKHDLAAIRYAGEFSKQTGLRAHCNVEPSTLVLGGRHIAKIIRPGVVIELVERYDQIGDSMNARSVERAVEVFRKAGAIIAMDDVTPTDLERELIRRIRPDIIKVENRDALAEVSKFAYTRHLIAERVETEWHAQLARLMGVIELQGYWCDAYRRKAIDCADFERGVERQC